MPSPFDDNRFISELPPDVGPITTSRGRGGQGSPERPQRDLQPERPKEEKPREVLVSDNERQRPPAQTLVNGRQGPKWVIDIEGVLGDLTPDGVDLLVGYIARINGIGFAASAAFRHRNPGGFGLTIEGPAKLSPFHMFPAQGSSFARPWMDPLYEFCALAQKHSDPIERRQYMKPVTFPSFQAGGDALKYYIEVIRGAHVPYFFQGPMTPIAEFLTVFNAPMQTTTTYKWSQLLPFLENANRPLAGAPGQANT